MKSAKFDQNILQDQEIKTQKENVVEKLKKLAQAKGKVSLDYKHDLTESEIESLTDPDHVAKF